VTSLNHLQQLSALLQPRLWIGGAPEIDDLAVPVYNDGCRALDNKLRPLQIESVIHLMRWISQDWKG